MASDCPSSPRRKRGEAPLHATIVEEDSASDASNEEKKEKENEKRSLLPRPPKCECLETPCTGYICAVLSALLFTTHALLFKLNEKILHFSNALFSRMLIGLVSMTMLIACCRDAFLVPWDDLKWILFSAFLLLGSTIFFYVATTMMPFADVIAIFFTQCGPTVIFAWLFLEEPFGIYEVGILVSAIVGVLLVAHPPDLFANHAQNMGLDFRFNTTPPAESEFYELFDIKILDRSLGALIAFSAALCASANLVVLRRLSSISVFTINFYISILGVIITAIIVSTLSSWEVELDSTDDYAIVAAQCLSGLIGSLLLIAATKYTEAGVISVILTLEIVFAYIVQQIVLGVKPSASAAIGAILITVVCIIYGLKGFFDSRVDDGIAKSVIGRRGTGHW